MGRKLASIRRVLCNPPVPMALTLLMMPTMAYAQCSIGRIAELPVTLSNYRPLVPAKIQDKPVRLIVDSGAFWSLMPPASAQSLALTTKDAPAGFFIEGGNGAVAVKLTNIDVTLAETKFPHVDFLVGGTDIYGAAAGVIGQNFLGIADVEYDLANGVIRFWRPKGCGKSNLAYWSAGQPLSQIPIDPTTPLNSHATTTVYLNGVKLRAMLSTGSPTSVLTKSAAHRAGIDPGGPGVTESGESGGIGMKHYSTWTAKFDSFEVGGIKVVHPTLRFADADFGAEDKETDMLLGLDFFLSNRILISTSQHLLYFTYNGGRLFNVSRLQGASEEASRPPQTSTAGPPIPPVVSLTDATGFARRGAAMLSRGDTNEAIGNLDKAIALTPNDAEYHSLRAQAYMAKGDATKAMADMDAAVTADPTNPRFHLTRAFFDIYREDQNAARKDVDAAAAILRPQSREQMDLGHLYIELGAFPQAVAAYNGWIASHKADGNLRWAYNGRCWARALGNIELDQALADCNKSVAIARGESVLDSRALVYLRRGEYGLAVADYDAALALEPGDAWSRYCRGIAKIKLGQDEDGRTDMAAALEKSPKVADRAKRFGVTL